MPNSCATFLLVNAYHAYLGASVEAEGSLRGGGALSQHPFWMLTILTIFVIWKLLDAYRTYHTYHMGFLSILGFSDSRSLCGSGRIRIGGE